MDFSISNTTIKTLKEIGGTEPIIKGFSIDYKLDKFYKDFIEYLDLNSEASLNTYKYNLKDYINYINETGRSPLDRHTLIDYKKDLLLKGYKASSINTHLVAIKSFYKYLYMEGYILKNIAEDIKAEPIIKGYKKDIPTLIKAKEMIERTKLKANTEEGKRNLAILVLLLTTGIREKEVINIKLEDITLKEGEKVIYLLGKGRQDKEEYIKLPNQVEALITDYLASKQYKEATYLFTSTSNNSLGKQLSTRTIRSIIKNIFIEAGLNSERLTTHSLRHYCLTHILLNGGTIEEARQVARHQDNKVIYNYLHSINRNKNNSENKVANELLGGNE